MIPNGVDTEVFCPDTGVPAHGRAGLVWTGRFVPEKAPHLAIAAAAASGRPLRLMGPIRDPDYFDREVRGLLGPEALYVGHLDRDAVAREMRRAAACLVSSVWPEPFGLIAAEALTCGTPVVAFRVGGLADVVDDPLAGRAVPVGDVAAMAAAVDEVVALDRPYIAAAAGRRFSLRTMAGRYLNLFPSRDNRRGRSCRLGRWRTTCTTPAAVISPGRAPYAGRSTDRSPCSARCRGP